MPNIKLFQYKPTRSQRPVWTLAEAGLDYEAVGEGQEVFSDPELAKAHPLIKLPAAVIDGQPLFESAAISTYLADLVPEKNLVAKPGTYERALHDQWTCFTLTELEAWLWSSAVNSFVLPEEKRLDVVHDQNRSLFRRSAAAMNDALENQDYLVGNRFSVTDIIASFSVNWGRRLGWTEDFNNLHGYLDRLFHREHCPLDQSASM